MFKFNIPATRIVFCEEAFADGAAGTGAQGVEERIANALYGGNSDAGDDQQQPDALALDDNSLPAGEDADVDGGKPEDGVVAEDGNDDITLASMLGLDDDKLEYDENNNVVFNAIIDGETHKVPVHELVKSYQLQGHVNNKSIALENERKQFDTTRTQAYQELTNRLNGLDNLIKMNEDSLLAEYNNIDWNTLRLTEPGEWAALQQQFQQRLGQINQVKQMADQERARGTEEQQRKQQDEYQSRVTAEISKMIAENPAWSDQSIMAKEIGEIGAFLRNTYGFTDQEIADNVDARLMRMFKDAMKFHSGTKGIEDKKVKPNVPKFQKPGTSGDRPSLQKARLVKAQKENIRRSGGSVDSIAQALLSRSN